jgi:hypothetical protein
MRKMDKQHKQQAEDDNESMMKKHKQHPKLHEPVSLAL